jgi:hypothetical protein
LPEIPAEHQHTLLSDCLYREGAYFRAHEALFSAPAMKVADKLQKFRKLIDRSFKYRNAGAFLSAKLSFWKANCLWNKLSDIQRNEHEDSILWSVVLNHPFAWSARWKKAVVALSQIYQKSGRWGALYNLKIHLKQRGPKYIKIDRELVSLMEAREGFKHIGNVSSYVDEFSRNSYLETNTPEEFESMIAIAEQFGLLPNCWKCCYAALCSKSVRGLRFRVRIFKKCISHLFKCEYAAYLKAWITFRATLALFRFSRWPAS